MLAKRRDVPERQIKQAITAAISNAASGDVVLIAGKGHETYQEISRIFYDYDEFHSRFCLKVIDKMGEVV